MDSTAIEKIQQGQAELLAKLQAELSNHSTQIPCMVMPHGFSIDSLEGRMEFRARFRGVLKTRSPDNFQLYCERHDIGEQQSACFVSDKDLSAEAIIDLGEAGKAGHCDHRALLQLPYSPEYNAMMNIESEHCSQRVLAEWVEEWRHLVTFFKSIEDLEANKPIPMASAISAIRTMELENRSTGTKVEGHHASSMSVLEAQELKNAKEFPTIMRVTCSPAEELQERDFIFRISVVNSSRHTGPGLIPHMLRKQATQRDIAKEFASLVENLLDATDMVVFQGEFSVGK